MSHDSDKQLLERLREHNAEKSKPSIHDTSQEKVKPAVIITISIYIVAFLSLATFAELNPEDWFVKNFLAGPRIFLAGLLLLWVGLLVMSEIEHQQKKRTFEQQRKKASTK